MKPKFEQHKASDGKVNLTLTGPPMGGLSLKLSEKSGAPSLVLETAQQTYVFERK